MNIQCTPAMADALTKILNYESIPYKYGVGPGCIALIIDRKDVKRAKNALSQWKNAIDMACLEVGLSELTLDP